MKLNIYMKSGNLIKLYGIESYKIENKGNELLALSLNKDTEFLE